MKVYVTGHHIADVDSIVSTILMTNILKKWHVNAEAILPTDVSDYTTKMMLQDCDISLPQKIKPLEKDGYYFLVDHNNPAQSIGLDHSIIGCIDHHNDTGILPQKHIEKSCSTALLIYKKYHQQYSFNVLEKRLIYFASLEDGNFGISVRMDEESKQVLQSIGFKTDAETLHTLFKKYFIPTDLSKGMKVACLSGYKELLIAGEKLPSSYIKSYGKEKMEEYFKTLREAYLAFIGIWYDYEALRTIVDLHYQDGSITKEYRGIASRAAVIEEDIKQYIIGGNKK